MTPSSLRFFLISCIDIDECFEVEDACGEGEVGRIEFIYPINILTTQTCLNTEGSFICNLAEDVEVRLTYTDVKLRNQTT